jgi:glycosyltransferase involved in cell wall biosynthesis
MYAPAARLFLVGPGHLPAYREFLENRIAELELGGVTIAGRVSRDELRGYYRAADLFLCLSEHEGFCLPLLESFYYRIPVVAYAAGAIPETLGGAGVLLRKKNPDRVAALLNRILTDRDLREKIVAGQSRRLKDIERDSYEDRLRKSLGL